jgi:hypothetical protein
VATGTPTPTVTLTPTGTPTTSPTLAPSPTATPALDNPDLVAVSVSTDRSVVLQGAEFAFSGTIRNDGYVTFPGSELVLDRFYLSLDQTFDGGDLLMRSVKALSSTSPGSSYYHYGVTVGAYVPVGEYYAILNVDADGVLTELSETNNVVVSSGKVTVRPNKPDLVAVSVSSGSSWVAAGQPLSIAGQIQNQGFAAAYVPWVDRVYLSSDQNLDAGDLLLGEATRGEWLPAGGSYSVSISGTAPTALGDYYLILFTDVANVVASEISESNNLTVSAEKIAVMPDKPDLVPLWVTALQESIVIGQTLGVSAQVQNQGYVYPSGFWVDSVYLSVDTNLDAGDILLGHVTAGSPSPGPGASYYPSGEYSIPPVPPGLYYLILKADAGNGITELDETNNTVLSSQPVLVSWR